MPVRTELLTIRTPGRGLFEITAPVAEALRRAQLQEGTVTVFCQHTSCSLVIMENADPSARRDLEFFMEKLVPPNFPGFIHTLEGDDDMPSHVKMALTRTSEVVPFRAGQLLLGTWQGIYLWEHRKAAHQRTIILTLQGE